MNQSAQILIDSHSLPVRCTCPRCGYILETAEEHCADCGKLLQSVSTKRILGIVLVVLGTVLLGMMGWLSASIYSSMSPGVHSGGRFNGSAYDMSFIVFVFGLVISIGLAVTVGGAWQIIFGKRNRSLVFAVFGLGVIFAVTGVAVAMQNFWLR